jgi:anti-anti-sigma factor
LAQTLDDLRASQETLRELSAPIIPVLPGVLVAPLIGALDSTRAAVLTSNILRMVQSHQARYVIIDITGVPFVDTHVAGILMRAAAAVRLLGAQVWLVGIRPEVAQTIVILGIDLQTISTHPDLQAAVTLLSAKQASVQQE